MIHLTSRGFPIRILNHNDFENSFKTLDNKPHKVLVTSWSDENSKKERWVSIVEKITKIGKTHFVCAGSFAERLHDNIDEIVFESRFDYEIDDDLEVITSYHDDETIDDVLNFIFEDSALSNGECLFLAILNRDSVEDEKFRVALLEY